MHIDLLLRDAVERKASDLHLSVGASPVYRIDGRLIRDDGALLTNEDTKQIANEILTKSELGTLFEKGEVDIAYEISGVSRFRINIYSQRKQITIAARIIPSHIPSLEDLSMPHILEELAMKTQGLILVTGPTGSGKSTTLASMLDLINQRMSKHIITLEDPIEYVHHHKKSVVHQREISSDTNNFANGLRASLRQDPDVILVGEMRDLETISTAITAAETGHLVLATLHTNGAAQTINRIIDVFPPNQQPQIRIQLADFLQGIVSQRLLSRADDTGRVAATEILVNQPSVSNLIRNAKVDQIANIIQTSRAQGMHLMDVSIKRLVANNIVTQEEANKYLNKTGGLHASL